MPMARPHPEWPVSTPPGNRPGAQVGKRTGFQARLCSNTAQQGRGWGGGSPVLGGWWVASQTILSFLFPSADWQAGKGRKTHLRSVF